MNRPHLAERCERYFAIRIFRCESYEGNHTVWKVSVFGVIPVRTEYGQYGEIRSKYGRIRTRITPKNNFFLLFYSCGHHLFFLGIALELPSRWRKTGDVSCIFFCASSKFCSLFFIMTDFDDVFPIFHTSRFVSVQLICRQRYLLKVFPDTSRRMLLWYFLFSYIDSFISEGSALQTINLFRKVILALLLWRRFRSVLFFVVNFLCSLLKDTHREIAPSNNTPARRKSTNMGVWAVDTLNQLFIRGS